MSDILVTSPAKPFTLPNQFKAVFNGYIYCGTVDAADPSVSQVQVYKVNEDGSRVQVAQPLRTNAGGFLVYNGQPAKFVTDSSHSLLVRDSLGAQLWYEPNMSAFDPETFIAALAAPDGVDLVGGAAKQSVLSGEGGAAEIGKAGGGTVQDFLTSVAQDGGANQIGYNAGVGGSKTNVLLRLRKEYKISDFRVDTDDDWTNAFTRAAASGEPVNIYTKDERIALYDPILINAPTTFFCEGGAAGFKQLMAKAHAGSMFVIASSKANISGMDVANDEVLGSGGNVIMIDTSNGGIEEVRLSKIKQSGGTCGFLRDTGSNLIVDLGLDDIKLQAPLASGIVLTKAFAYLDMNKVTVNYVPSSSRQFTGISVTGNEGARLNWCHVNHGITTPTPNSYGFLFSNSKAIWISDSQADTCGADGFRFDNCQYVYANKISASLCGGDGLVMTGNDYTIGNSYFGGRKGLAYPGASGSALVRSLAGKSFINGCNLSNGGFNGFVATASTVLSGGGIFNTVQPYTISGVAKLRQVMNDSGSLIDAG